MIHKVMSEQHKFALYLHTDYVGIVDTFCLTLERLQLIYHYIYRLTRIS